MGPRSWSQSGRGSDSGAVAADNPCESPRLISTTRSINRSRDGPIHVAAFDRDAALAGVEERAPGGGLSGALDVGVGGHDHGVVATKFQQQRRALSGRGLGDRPGSAGAADEDDFFDPRAGQRQARFPTPADHLKHRLGRVQGIEGLLQTQGRLENPPRRLQNHGVSRQQRRHRGTEGQSHRVVPGRDTAHHAQRPIVDRGPLVPQQARNQPPRAEDLGAVLGIIADRPARLDHFVDRVHPRFIDLAADGGHQLIQTIDQRGGSGAANAARSVTDKVRHQAAARRAVASTLGNSAARGVWLTVTSLAESIIA